MPPPPPPPSQQQRRPTRPRPMRRRVFARSSSAISALESGLDAIIASGQATRTGRDRRAADATRAGPSAGAGDELFVASPLTMSPAPSPTPTRKVVTPALPPAELRSPTPSPRTPRFLAPLPAIAVGRFPSPPGRGQTMPPATAAVTTAVPPSMPALSPSSPMDTTTATTSKTSYATVARTTIPATGFTTTAATTSSAATTAATTAVAAAATANTTAIPKPANRYPPLIVEVLPDWPTHFRELKKRLGHAPNGRPFGKGVRFLPKSDQEFRLIQRYLTELESAVGISWFCYSLPAERSVKVAIRGLPANTEPALVEQELRELGYTPEHVRAIPARPGRPGCLMFAQLQRTPNTIPGIYETCELLCMPGIIIEAWRGRKGPAQCHRCQQFRHSSHNCHRPIACVRCGENHMARDCPRPREEAATCANCGGAHTANNAACPAYRKEARNRRAGTVARTSVVTRSAAAATTANEPNAPGSLMAAANQPQQQPGRKRRRKRGKRTAPQPNQSKPTVVAASEKRTKAKRVTLPQPAPQPARGPLDPRLTTVVGTLNRILMAIQEQRDPVPLILGCITELCSMYG